MNDLFLTLFGCLGVCGLSFLLSDYIYKLMNPFMYKITYTNKKGN